MMVGPGDLRRIRRLASSIAYAGDNDLVRALAGEIAAIVAGDVSRATPGSAVDLKINMAATIEQVTAPNPPFRALEPPPALCGCGRDLHHYGRCRFRRPIAPALEPAPPPASKPRGGLRQTFIVPDKAMRFDPEQDRQPYGGQREPIVTRRGKPAPWDSWRVGGFRDDPAAAARDYERLPAPPDSLTGRRSGSSLDE